MSSMAALVLLVAGAASAGEARDIAPPPAGVTIVLVRHAEAETTGADPALSAVGQQRAKCLASGLESLGITHVFASPWRRAVETANALAVTRSLEVKTRDPMKAGPLAEELRALPAGSRALVVGHSNTLPLLASAFGLSLTGLVEESGQSTIPRAEHDRIVVIELHGAHEPATLAERRQGCDPPTAPVDPR